MSEVLFAHDILDQRETSSGMLRRLWDEVEQRLAAQAIAPQAVVSTPAGARSARHREVEDAMPTRVRYAFD